MAEEISTFLTIAHAHARLVAVFELLVERTWDFLNARPDLTSAQQAELVAAESLIEEIKALVDELGNLKENIRFLKDNPFIANRVALKIQSFKRRLNDCPQILRRIRRTNELEVIARDLKEKLKEHYTKLTSIALAVNMVTTIGIVASAAWSYFRLSKQR